MLKSIRGTALAIAVMLLGSVLAPGVAQAAPADSQAERSAEKVLAWPRTNPNPEHWERASSQQAATDWVNRCPAGRYCTWIRDGSSYSLFQFYRCTEYALTDFLGTTNFFNNQNVSVQLLGSRHEVLRTHSPGQKFITNWDAVWYINLCA